MLPSTELDRELAIIEARLRLIEWRNAQTEKITEQFETAWPELEADIQQHVETLSLTKVAQTHAHIHAATQALLAPWIEQQTLIAAVRAEDDLAQIIALLPREGIAGHAWTVLPAVAGLGLIAASIFSIPAVVSFATVSVLGVSLGTSSVPILLAGSTAFIMLSLTGSSVVGKALRRGRSHLTERMIRHARSVIFGDGRPPSERCVLSDTQAAVLTAAQTALEA